MKIHQNLLALIIALNIASCSKDKSNPDPDPVDAKNITITELKALSTGVSVKVPDATKTTGIVISDASGKNIDGKTVVLQEATDKPGIVVTFDTEQTFAVGDQIEVNISGQTLAQVNGEAVLQNIPVANAKKTGTGSISAKSTTTTEILANMMAWDGTLVKLNGGGFSGGEGTYNGSLTYTDSEGTIRSDVLASASFGKTAYPVSIDAFTGIVRIKGGSVTVDMRNSADVVANTTITRVVTEDFSTYQEVSALAFTTEPLGRWQKKGTVSFRTLLEGDESFLQPGKDYMYLLGQNPTAQLTFGSGSDILKGLKQIVFTLSASAFTGEIEKSSTVMPFDPNQGVNEITLWLGDPTAGTAAKRVFKVAQISFKDVGESHTFTYKLPGSLEELQAAMLAMGENSVQVEANVSKVFNSQQPIIQITNTSSQRTGEPENVQQYYKQPLILEKMELGFSN